MRYVDNQKTFKGQRCNNIVVSEYLAGLNRATYDFSADGRIAQPKNQSSQISIEAFVKVLDLRGLEYTVEEQTGGSVHTCSIKQNEAVASLQVNYGGSHGYHAKVVFKAKDGQRELNAQNGVDVAARKILKYLEDPSSVERTTRMKKPKVDNTLAEEVSEALRMNVPRDVAEDFYSG